MIKIVVTPTLKAMKKTITDVLKCEIEGKFHYYNSPELAKQLIKEAPGDVNMGDALKMKDNLIGEIMEVLLAECVEVQTIPDVYISQSQQIIEIIPAAGDQPEKEDKVFMETNEKLLLAQKITEWSFRELLASKKKYRKDEEIRKFLEIKIDSRIIIKILELNPIVKRLELYCREWLEAKYLENSLLRKVQFEIKVKPLKKYVKNNNDVPQLQTEHPPPERGRGRARGRGRGRGNQSANRGRGRGESARGRGNQPGRGQVARGRGQQ